MSGPVADYSGTGDSNIYQHLPKPGTIATFPLTATVQPLEDYPAALLVKGVEHGNVPNVVLSEERNLLNFRSSES